MTNTSVSETYLKKLEQDYQYVLSLFSDEQNKLKDMDNILRLYLDVEQQTMAVTKKLWKDEFIQEAYSFIKNRQELFVEKIAWAKALIKARPLLTIEFFGDVFFLRDIDPLELALYLTHQQILQTFLMDYPVTGRSLNGVKQDGNVEFKEFFKLLVSRKFINDTQSMILSENIAVQVYTKQQLSHLLKQYATPNRKGQKELLIDMLLNLSSELNIDAIEKPIQFNFRKDALSRLECYFEQREIEEALLYLVKKHELYVSSTHEEIVFLELSEETSEVEVEALEPFKEENVSPDYEQFKEFEEEDERLIEQPKFDEEFWIEEDDFLLSEMDVSQATNLAETIFIRALEKGINYLTEPIHIDFELEDVEDLVANYPINTLKSALDEINRFQSITKKNVTSSINTLESVRKFLHGKIEDAPSLEWRDYAPKTIKSFIKDLSLEDAYTIVLAKSKDNTITGKIKDEIMNYRFDLEELIFGEREQLYENPYIFEEFKEYSFEEYVRRTVEAIILPHVEVLERIETQKGKIQFVDIWSQHFSDELKQKVRERDGFKCVVCDEETHLHVHHKVPRKYGGVNHVDNLVTLCSSCHGAIETADFEHAYQKCMMNAIKIKTSLQKPVNTMKDLYLLKEEILTELDQIFVKASKRDELLGQEVLQVIKKIEFVFEG